jgi:diguanylate cyclase (GGDEF)-like protein
MVSLLSVIVGGAFAFRWALATGDRTAAAAGALLGLSIAIMHYTGMMAYRVDGIVEWEVGYIVASIVVAMLFGAAAILASNHRRSLLALLMFVAAVIGLHFIGMTAVSVTPLITGAPIAGTTTVAAMAVAVAGVALLIVGTGIVSHMIDTDTTERNLDALRHMAMNDALTGLPNRNSFNTYLGHELHRAEVDGHRIAVIGIDLDKFKEINDLRGHEAGDQALKIIGSRLAAQLRDGEFFARIGGDEFAAVKRFREQHDLLDFVSRIERELFDKMRIDEFEVSPGASIGVSVYPQDGDNAARLIGNADLAMYRAKADVTCAVCFYESEMDERARERRDLALDLRRAIELEQFELHYQVQTRVSAREQVVGYEVLLRWRHPTRGLVSPSEFIPLAEETGTILAIGDWVLREACRQAAQWSSDEKIAVNLSAIQLTHCDMPKLVHEVLLETGLPASRLELEITESSIIHDKIRSLHALRQIRALGVTIAIDDFGTGYSSFETLRTFPFDRIKLDRSFMNEVETSAQSRAIIRAVLALGKSLDISVLAEGVETERQLQLLATEGCNEAQGYLLGRPAPRPFEGSARVVTRPAMVA